MKFVKFWSLFAVGLFLISGLAVVGTTLAVPIGSGPTNPLPKLAALAAAEVAGNPSLQAVKQIDSQSQITNSLFTSAVGPVLGQYSSLLNAFGPKQWAEAHDLEVGNMAGFQSMVGYEGTTIELGGLTVAALVCVTAGVETVGLACLAALTAVAIIVIAVNFICGISNLVGLNWGCSTPPGAAAAQGVGDLILSQVGFDANVQEQALSNELQDLNDTVGALSYSAANAALFQLPNGTFNGPLDAAQSGVAEALASVFYADGEAVASIEVRALASMNYYEYQGDTSGYTCALSGPQGYTTAPVNVGSCGSATPGDIAAADTVIYPTWELNSIGIAPTSGNEYWLLSGSTVQISLATAGVPGVLTLAPVSGGPWYNITFLPSLVTDMAVTNATLTLPNAGPNGMGYHVFSATSTVSAFYSNYLMPLNNASMPSSVYYPYLLAMTPESPTTAGEPPNTINTPTSNNVVITGSGTEQSLFGGNDYTANSVVSQEPAQLDLGLYLMFIQSVTVSEGQAYWAFLHYSLGYTAVSQIPLACLIPNPAQLIPPNIPLSELETMTPEQILNLYQSEIRALGYTFEGQYLNLTVCGQHVVPDPGNTSLGLGIYGYGYIYVAGAADNSNGTTAQVFGQPDTWNYSGAIELFPTVASLAAIPVNHTFIFGANNVVTALVSPFVKNVSNTVVVNATGPTYCSVHGGAYGCAQDSLTQMYLSNIVGNSSSNGGVTGSVYPTGKTAGAGEAVFFTECFSAVAGSPAFAPTFATNQSCLFGEQRINNTYTPCPSGDNAVIKYVGGIAIQGCETPTGPPILVGSATCGIGGILGTIVGDVATVFQIFGNTIACDIAWVVLLIVGIVLVYAVVRVIVSATRRRGGE